MNDADLLYTLTLAALQKESALVDKVVPLAGAVGGGALSYYTSGKLYDKMTEAARKRALNKYYKDQELRKVTDKLKKRTGYDFKEEALAKPWGSPRQRHQSQVISGVLGTFGGIKGGLSLAARLGKKLLKKAEIEADYSEEIAREEQDQVHKPKPTFTKLPESTKKDADIFRRKYHLPRDPGIFMDCQSVSNAPTDKATQGNPTLITGTWRDE